LVASSSNLPSAIKNFLAMFIPCSIRWLISRTSSFTPLTSKQSSESSSLMIVNILMGAWWGYLILRNGWGWLSLT
jgi:hypothetical protein